MKSKKFLFVVIFATGWLSLFAQQNEDYRLKALSFFCSNKDDIFRIDHPIFGKVSPIFLLDVRMNENGDFYIDSDFFNPDTVVLDIMLRRIKEDDYIDNKNNILSRSTDGFNDTIYQLCDCIYIDPFIEFLTDDCPSLYNSFDCKREFVLRISRVLSYKGLKYVILYAVSYYKRKVHKTQHFLVEFSADGNILRCGVEDPFFE